MLDVEAKGGRRYARHQVAPAMLVSAFRRGDERGRRLKMSSVNFDLKTFCDHAAHGRLADVQRMFESGELPVNVNLNDALMRAAENGHVDVVDYLLRHAMFDPSDNRAIILAAYNGHLAVAERLLQDDRVDPSADNNSAVRLAVWNGHLAVVERLLQDGRVDPSANDSDAVGWAAEFGHLAVVERLLQDKRVDPSSDNNNAVRCAAFRGHLAVVDRLLEDDRVDFIVAIQYSLPEHRKRFECRERLTEICIALQDLALPAWVTVQILDAARPWSTLPLHSKWSLVCAVKHFHDKRLEQ
jgi:ankyrin repeat protein